MEVEKYPDILKSLKNKKDRKLNLLIGNGFSIAYNKDMFSYNALSKFVQDTDNEDLKKLFNIINTDNFEQIMRELNLFEKIVKEFDEKSILSSKLDTISKDLKNSLIKAVDELHPEVVFSIPEDECNSCAHFLAPFLESNGQIFSTNYDLLLYWVLMRKNMENCIDGFGRDLENEDEVQTGGAPCYSELHWGKHKEEQNIHYLHGALPIFDYGYEIIKEEYDGSYLLDKIKARMEKNNYPIFVAAGTGDEKLNHIMHNHYLSYCYDRLCSISGSLVTFGFNFGPYDEHIIKAINKAAGQNFEKKLWSIYIGVYSDSDKKHIEEIAEKFKIQKIHLFDAKTVDLWRCSK